MAVPMFSLTELTGREASAQRTVVIGTVEMNWRVWMVLVWTFPLAVIVAAFFYPFLQAGSLLIIPAVEGGALYMIHRRTRSGLKLRTYQALWDRKKSATNTFFICGQPIDLALDNFMVLANAAVPNPYYKPSAQALPSPVSSDLPFTTPTQAHLDSLFS